MAGVIYSTLLFGIVGFLCWRVSVDGPRERGGAYWRGRPGLRTGTTLSSEAAWVAAHRRIARPLRLTAHASGAAVLVSGAMFALDISAGVREAFVVVALLGMVAVLAVLAGVGERAGRAALDKGPDPSEG